MKIMHYSCPLPCKIMLWTELGSPVPKCPFCNKTMTRIGRKNGAKRISPMAMRAEGPARGTRGAQRASDAWEAESAAAPYANQGYGGAAAASATSRPYSALAASNIASGDDPYRRPTAAAAGIPRFGGARPAAAAVDNQSEDEEESKMQDGDDDFLIVPPRPYNIGMRLTPADHIPRHQVDLETRPDAGFRKRMTQKVGSSPKRDNAATIMGRALGYSTKCEAWRHAGAVAYTTNKFSSYEWCHLIADSLGGVTAENNLVAASFSANTHMGALEMLLKGQSSLLLQVTANCQLEHLAISIEYTIRCPAKNKRYSVLIDGTVGNFSEVDVLREQGKLRAWLKECDIDVA